MRVVLASRLSIKPETLSRVLRELCERQIISVHGSEVIILNRQGLARVAEVEDVPETPVSKCAAPDLAGGRNG